MGLRFQGEDSFPGKTTLITPLYDICELGFAVIALLDDNEVVFSCLLLGDFIETSTPTVGLSTSDTV